MVTRLAVAALSARMLTQAAREEGLRSVALDLFGDADTRRAAEAWRPIGEPGCLAIDAESLLAALRGVAERGEAEGWIAGSGFEGRAGLLAAGGRILPLLGNPPEVVEEVRSPARFFGMLAALGIPHPETRTDPPARPAGWLLKDAGGSGGWNVRPAEGPCPAGPGHYFQRFASGEPMSALFVAAQGQGRIIGVNRQIVARLGGRPYVFRGCIGPVPLPPGARDELARVVGALAAKSGLRGLNGLDFLLDGERLTILEVNPRPPASMALYGGGLTGGLVRGHLATVVEGRLPLLAGPPPGGAQVRGFEIVFARRHCRIDGKTAAALGRIAWCHDIPAGSLWATWGEPLCTVSAEADSPAEVKALLTQRRREIRSLLEHANG